ncbi:MAG: hypothetical protein IKU12_04645 [Oscillospiraceae bacterium]|nr:hypothetical protein [Oscillospiraceae bacterium]
MTRKVKAFLCALLMVLTLTMPQMGGSAAAASVIYTAMNDSLLELSDETMPFWHGSYLYLPAASVASTGMGVNYVYNTAKQTVVLYTNSSTIIFDLAANTAQDQNGKTYAQTCIRRNGRPFVPASVVAKVLGLSYSNIKVSNGYLVRLCSAGAVLTDSVFADAAVGLMNSRYKDYIRSTSQAGENTPDNADETVGSHSLYLSLTVTDAQSAASLAGVAASFGCGVLFFFSEDLLFDPAAADAVRQIVCSGCSIGLYAGGSNTLAQLEKCNDQLFALTNRKTRLVRLGDESADAVQSAGYCVFSADVVRSGSFASSATKGVVDAVGSRSRAVKVYLGESVTADGLRTLLASLREKEYALLRFTEVTA